MKLNKWIDPTFWRHPTPVNLAIIIFGFIILITTLVFVSAWFFYFAGNYIPWPPRY